MTLTRRTLRYESFDDVMPDVERLLQGHSTVGRWTLAQICSHLALVLRRHIDLPAATVFDPADRAPEERKTQVMAMGVLPDGIQAPLAVAPGDALDDREEAENLRAALAYYLASPGPVATHRILGPLTKEEWDRFELIHLAHHLSFAVPNSMK